MDPDNNINSETPDLDFSENQAETVQNVNYSEEQIEQIFEAMEQETPDLDFSEPPLAEPADDLPRYTDGDEDVDDLEEPDQYVEDDESDAENNDNDTNDDPKKTAEGKSKSKDATDNRLVHLPLARVKQIMKADPEVSLITGECTFLVTKATELFIQSLAREAFVHTAQARKKTIQKRDVDAAFEAVESLMFLEGMMDF